MRKTLRSPRINLARSEEWRRKTALERIDEASPIGVAEHPFEEVASLLSAEVLCVLLASWEERERLEILERVGSEVAEETRLEARSEIRKRLEAERSSALQRLPGGWSDILRGIRELESEDLRGLALQCVIHLLPKEQLGDALAIAAELANSWPSVGLLCCIAPFLSSAQLGRVAKVARRLSVADRLRLLPILSYLPKAVASAVVRQIRTDLDELSSADNEGRQLGIKKLLTNAPATLLDGILHWVARKHGEDLAETVQFIAPRLQGKALGSAISLAAAEADIIDRALTFAALLPHVGETARDDMHAELLQIARESSGEQKAIALICLIRLFRGSDAAAAMREGISVAREISSEECRLELLKVTIDGLGRMTRSLAMSKPELSLDVQRLWGSVLEVIKVSEGSTLAEALTDFSASAPSSFIQGAWELALGIPGEAKSPVLRAVARRFGEMPMDWVSHQIFSRAPSPDHFGLLSQALASLPPERRESLADFPLPKEGSARNRLEFVEAAASLATGDSGHYLSRLLDMGAPIQDSIITAAATWSLGVVGPDARRKNVMLAALNVVEGIRHESLRGRCLLMMGPAMPDELKPSLLGLTAALSSKGSQTAVLRALARDWPDAVVMALSEVPEIAIDDTDYATVAAGVSVGLTQVAFDRALERSRQMVRETDRSAVLVALSSVSGGPRWHILFSEVEELASDQNRARLLAALGVHAPDELLSEVLQKARSLPCRSRLLVLHALVPQLLVRYSFERLVEEALALEEPGLWVKLLVPAAAEVPAARRLSAWRALRRLPKCNAREMVLFSFFNRADDDRVILTARCNRWRGRRRRIPAVVERKREAPTPVASDRGLDAGAKTPSLGLGSLTPAAATGSSQGPGALGRIIAFQKSIIAAARFTAHVFGDQEGAHRLIEFALAMKPLHAVGDELAAVIVETFEVVDEGLTGWPSPRFGDAKPSEVVPSAFLSAPQRAHEHHPRANLAVGGGRAQREIGETFTNTQESRVASSRSLLDRVSQGVLLAVGQSAFDRGWYRAAIQLWSRLVSQDERDVEADARIASARSLIEQEEPYSVNSLIPGGDGREPQASNRPSEEARDLLLREGQEAFDAGQFKQAIDTWSRVFLIDIDDVDASEGIEAARDCLAGRATVHAPYPQMALLRGLEAALRAFIRQDLAEAERLRESICRRDASLDTSLERLAKYAVDVMETRNVADRERSQRISGGVPATDLGNQGRDRRTDLISRESALGETEVGTQQASREETPVVGGRVGHEEKSIARSETDFAMLTRRALTLLDSGSLDRAVDTWMLARASDRGSPDDGAVRVFARVNFEPLCRARVEKSLKEARGAIERGEALSAARSVGDALRVEPGTEAAVSLLREAWSLYGRVLDERAESLRYKLFRELREGDVEAAGDILIEICREGTGRHSKLSIRTLARLVRKERARRRVESELATFRRSCQVGNKKAALKACQSIFYGSVPSDLRNPQTEFAGWAVQLSRGCRGPFDPQLAFWPPVAGMRDLHAENLTMLVAVSLESQEQEGDRGEDHDQISLCVRGQAHFDRGELEAAIRCWQEVEEPRVSLQLRLARDYVRRGSEPLAREDVEQVLATIDRLPTGWSPTQAAWARTPEEFVIQLRRILHAVPDAWLLSLLGHVFSLPSAYLFSEGMSRMALRLMTVTPSTLWCDLRSGLFEQLAELTRPRFFAAIAFLAPVMVRMAGEEAASETAAAMGCLARGWS